LQIPRSSESRAFLPLKGDAPTLGEAQSPLDRTTSLRHARGIDMASKTSGKRGSAIIVLMVVAAIAGSPSTARAASAKQQATVVVSAPVVVPQLDYSFSVDASWAEASWSES
jgi:hypothetical protein